MYTDKLPPHDIQAEEGVLGSILIDGDAVLKVQPFLKPEMFYRDRDRYIYEASLAIAERQGAINQVTLAHELEMRGCLDETGGPAFLSHLVAIIPTPLHVEHYGRIVAGTYWLRRLITAGGEIVAMGYEGSPKVEELFTRAEDVLYAARPPAGRHDLMPLREVLDEFLADRALVETSPLGAQMDVVPTGFSDLDMVLGGLHVSDLVIIAARPGVGKTALGLSIVESVARQGASAAIFSLEMSRQQLATRLVSATASIDSHLLRLGLLTEAQEAKVMDAVGELSDLPVWVDDTPSPTLPEIRAKAKRLHQQHRLSLVMVDYLQLMVSGAREDNRVQEVSAISRGLKALARDLDCVVVAISQLNRSPEMRPSHRPLLSDLRESGAIEQDADAVLMLFAEALYYTEEEWYRRYPDLPYPRNLVEVNVAKHRHGPVGGVKLYFRREYTRFEDLPQTGEEAGSQTPNVDTATGEMKS